MACDPRLRKMKRKILLIVFTILLGLFSLTSCQKDEPENEEKTTPFVSDVQQEEPLVLADGKSKVLVVYAERDKAAMENANSIAVVLGRVCGAEATVLAEDDYRADAVEILVGKTNYPESVQVYESLGYGDSVVQVVGNKLVVAGYENTLRKNTLFSFLETLEEHVTEDKRLILARNFTFMGEPDAVLSAVPVMTTHTAEMTDTGDGCYMVSFKKAGSRDIESYLDVLGQNGYHLYASNTVDKQQYYTYTDDRFVLNLAYHPTTAKLRVLAESLSSTALPPRSGEEAFDTVCDTLLTQVGLYYDNGDIPKTDYANGMSYVMRLADGSFLVVDGGHNKESDADRLYEVMKKQAPDKEHIVIAAWFFSHAHHDHVGFFPIFAEKYADKLTVERFVFNFMGTSQKDTGDLAGQVNGLIPVFRGAKKTTAHPGQVFHIRNATVTILYTLDINDNESTPVTDSNNASVVFTVEAEGKKIIMLGDYSEYGDTLLSLYSADTLKSDIMQVAHHGVAGQGSSLYRVIAPEYALWPVGAMYIEFTGVNGNEYKLHLDRLAINEYMMSMEKSKVLVAEDNITVMTLKKNGITVKVYDTDTEYLSEPEAGI